MDWVICCCTKKVYRSLLLGLFLGLFNGACDEVPMERGELVLRLGHISDTHIIDEESPARMVRYRDNMGGAWRPQEAYTTQTLDATLDMLYAYHTGSIQPRRQIDFIVNTGDATDNAQFNELRWFMDTMDGEWVNPDSGAPDGLTSELPDNENPHLRFKAKGVREIPWYSVYGNHDGLSVGNFGIQRPTTDPQTWIAPLFGAVARKVGLHLLDPFNGNIFSSGYARLLPTYDQSPAILLANFDPMEPNGQVNISALERGLIPQDPNRHYTSKRIWIEEHLRTTSRPIGHGFTEAMLARENLQRSSLSYSVYPKRGVPIKLIVLDTVNPNPASKFPSWFGVMTRNQFSWMKSEVRAAKDRGDYVLIASHHPSEDFDIPQIGNWAVGKWEFRNFLNGQKNVLMHVAGHTHKNRVKVIKGIYPYIQVETSAIIDFPQEARFLEIYYLPEADRYRIHSHMVRHTEKFTDLALESFRRSTVNVIPKLMETVGAVTRFATMGPQEGLPKSAMERYGEDLDRDFIFFNRHPKLYPIPEELKAESRPLFSSKDFDEKQAEVNMLINKTLKIKDMLNLKKD